MTTTLKELDEVLAKHDCDEGYDNEGSDFLSRNRAEIRAALEFRNNLCAGWLIAIDDQLGSNRIGYAVSTDTYEEATKKLKALINRHVTAALEAQARGNVLVTREDLSLAAQMLTWGNDEGLVPSQERAVAAHQAKLFAMLTQQKKTS